jgi:hypothetical protein
MRWKAPELSAPLREVAKREGLDEETLKRVSQEKERSISGAQGILSRGSAEIWVFGGQCCAILGGYDFVGESVCHIQFG